jgi:ATP-dependent Lon protease
LPVPRRSPRKRTKRLETLELPVLPVRNTVVFPHLVTPLFIDRDRSLRAVEQAMLSAERTILVVAQKEADVERPTGADVYTIGTEAVIGRVLKMPDGTTSILVQGQRRVQLTEVLHDEPYMRVRGVPATEVAPTDNSVEALVRAVVSLYEKCTKLSPTIPDDHYVAAMNIDEPGPLADFVASDLDLSVAQRQELLETLDTAERLQKLSLLLGKELDVLELQSKIHSAVQEEVDKSQREYLLREQMKAIQKELGEADTLTRDLAQLRDKITGSGMPEAVRVKAEEELERLAAIPPGSPEMGVVRTYLDWLVTLPWSNATEDQLDIGEAAAVLERAHFGLDKVKERILEYMAVRKLAGARMRSPILCFVGPPGVGKTSHVPGPVHRRRHGPPLRARVARRHPRRGRDPRPPPHLRRGDARPRAADDAHGWHGEPRVHARRDRQGRRGLPWRPVGGVARSARPRAEHGVQRPLSGRAL